LTEVNPRYTASTELVEKFWGVALVDCHRRACESFAAPLVVPPLVVPISGGRTPKPRGNNTPRVVGKIILYSRSPFTAPDLSRFVVRAQHRLAENSAFVDALPYLADIPVPGTHIAAGQPICTLFARAANAESCLAKLLRRAAKLQSRLP
jgi:predicted ATP-grasp superfamily ATP-dependent carboligase